MTGSAWAPTRSKNKASTPLSPIVSAALAGEHHANDERNAPALAPLDAEEPGEPHLGILAVVAPPRCKPQPKPQGPTGAAAQTWSVPGAQELSATNAIQHDRLGEAKVFTKPRRPSSWDYPEAVEAGRWGNGRHRC